MGQISVAFPTANNHKNKIYVLQTIIKFANHKSKTANNHKNKIYALQTIIKFANHKSKTANKNNKGKKIIGDTNIQYGRQEGKVVV